MEATIIVPSAPHERADRFFLIYAIVLLLVVFVGFAPSLFLRVAFENPPIPLYLHFHGAILTGWFVLLVAQASLINSGNVSVHRKLGYFVAGYAAVVVVGGLMATLNVVSRDAGLGIAFDVDMAEVDPALGSGITYLAFISGVVWANIAGVVTFAALIAAAIIYRRRPDFHKRFILVATVSILGPALARISRIDMLGGEQGPFVPLALLSLLAAIFVYDWRALRRIHRATLLAVVFAIALSIFGTAISQTEPGLKFVRALA